MTRKVQSQNLISAILRAASSVLASAVVLAAGVLATPVAQAQTYTVLYTFTGGADGGNPAAGLVRDAAGNFYGTTAAGGDLSCTGFPDYLGCGVVFKIDTTGKETVL